ncbi:Phosphoserine aminotransferase [Erysiphe neolycopersici]|uniref:phosphoserine transaminase n=1 Tax=Erysiphe neolycopersici TaxID=212602 RepID=A0A420HW77_9PEZI|nr:Phosphoserine aminotransferase [Erysiphe neolycopersici]
MTSRSDITYFGAGPALLPTSVLESAAKALVNYEQTGLGLVEHSHRSAIASNILEQTKSDLAKFLEIPRDSYEILFMQGGGTGQFSATVYNFIAIWVARRKQIILKELELVGKKDDHDLLLSKLQKAVEDELKIDYLVTGSWSLKASQEATRLLGSKYVNVAADSRDINQGSFGKIPNEASWKLSKDAAMVYYCDNETVDGVEFPGFPSCLNSNGNEKNRELPNDPIVVADMSSNILSRRIPIEKFSLIFFGAQKNLGSTGITVVVIKRNLLPPFVSTPDPELLRKLQLPIFPIIFTYETIAKNNSLYNTLSIFDVYVAGQVLFKLLRENRKGIETQEALSNEKANLLYTILDTYPEKYHILPDHNARSRMNICFRIKHGLNSIELSEKRFLEGAAKLGLQGLKGHRSVGGIRASNYNSITLDDVHKLVTYIRDFATMPLETVKN